MTRAHVGTIGLLGALLLVSALAHAEESEGGGDAATEPARLDPSAPIIPSAAHGGPTPAMGEHARPTPSGVSGQVGGAVLFEKLDDDYFANLELYNRTRIGPLSFGLWVPLRFRVWDRDPQDDGLIRDRDWDEASDYARLLHFVELELSYPSWRFRGRFGALEGESLGHGTIVAGYFNSLDRDHYQAGLALSSALRYGGIEFMLDNLIAPEIFGVRLHVRPTSFFTDNAWAEKLVLGLSVASDVKAPVALQVEGTPPAPVVDGENDFGLDATTSVTVLGIDAEYALVQRPLLDLVPYLDVNFMFDSGGGAGLHLGTFFNLRLPTPVGPTLLTRLEYRAVGEGYAPRYVDTLYEVQRVQYEPDTAVDADGIPLTKLGWLRQRSSGTHGWLGELQVDLGGWVRLGGTYEDYQGPDNSALTLSLLLPKLKLFQLGAYYSRRGFDSITDAFDKDGALLLVYGRVAVWGPLALTLTYTRTWYAQDDGTYRAEGDYSVGAGLSFSY